MAPYQPDPAIELSAHASAVRRLARSLIYDADAAEDVAQSALCVAWERSAPGRQPPWTWFASIVRNVAQNVVRGERRRRHLLERAAAREAVAGVATPLDHVERIEAQRRVLEAVASLREPQRQAITLRYFEELGIDEIAVRTGTPRETVRTRLRTGLAQLRERLGATDGGESGRRRALLALAGGPAVVLWTGEIVVKTKALTIAGVAALLGVALWIAGPDAGPAASRPSEETASRTLEVDPRLVGREAGGATDAGPASDQTLPRLIGVVRDGPTAAPIAGARVRAFRADASEPHFPGDDAPETTTGADGRFELRVDGESPVYVVLADAADHSPAWVHARPASDVGITLLPERTISGVVRDVDDRPVPGATVRWLGLLGVVRHERETRTGEDGAFVLRAPQMRGMDVLSSALEAIAEGFAPVRVRLAGVTEVAGDSRVDILLLRGATLRGRVVVKGTDEAVAGARVFLWGECDLPGVPSFDESTAFNPYWTFAIGDVVSDDEGQFRFDHVPAWTGWPVGMYASTAWSRKLGHVATLADGYAVATREVTVPEDAQEVGVLLELVAAATVRGRVVSETGAPVEGAIVFWRWIDGSRAGWIDPTAFSDAPRSSVRTDSAGRYELPGMPASADGTARVEVVATMPGPALWLVRASHPVAARPSDVMEAPPLVVQVRPRAPAIDVLVTAPDGSPIAGAHVRGGFPSGGSGEDGRLRVYFQPSDVPASGSVTVAVMAVGHAPRSVTVAPSVASPPVTNVTLDAAAVEPERLPPGDPPPSTTLEGRIRDAETGRPILKFRVLRFYPDGTEGHAARVIGAGRFVFRDVGEGPWLLRAEAPGYETLERKLGTDAAADTGPLDLRLVRGVEARVRCRDVSGAPLKDGKVWFLAPGQHVEGTIDPEGTVVLRGLRADVAYEVTCAQSPATGLPRWLVPDPYGPVTLPASGEPVALVLTLQPAGVASISVRSAHLGDDEYSATPEQREARRATRATLIDPHGRTIWLRSRLIGSGWSVIVPPGPYTLRIEVPGAARFERQVTLAPFTTASATTIDVEVP